MNLKEEIWFMMNVLKDNTERVVDLVISGKQITRFQAMLLLWIDHSNSCSVSSLSSALKLNQGNTSSMCKKLEKLGYISRVRSTQDERMVTISLTKKGQEIVSCVHEKFTECEQLLQQYPKEKLVSISQGIQNLNEVIQYVLNVEENANNKRGENVEC